MSHFEYIFVAVSIVLSFTLLRLLDALPSALSRSRGYWVHTVWVLILLHNCATFWWLSWYNHDFERLTYRYYLFLLATPSVLYLTATALVSAAPAEVVEWREHFERTRRRFFMGASIYTVLLAVNAYVTFGIPLAHPLRFGQAVLLVGYAVGAVAESRRVDAWVAGIIGALMGAVVIASLLGWLPWSLA